MAPRSAVLARLRVSTADLRHNRDFLLLQAGQLLSECGTQFTTIAYPLLALALTHSPAAAGFVAFCRIVPLALLSLPAGLVADTHDRRRLMIGADVVRATAMLVLVVALASGHASYTLLALVAVGEGAGNAVFFAASAGSLPAVVAPAQLPAAIAARTARQATAALLGPPLGGALFAVARVLPFAVDVASYAASTISLLFIRTPFHVAAARDERSIRLRLTEGARFLWGQPFLRDCALLFGVGNFMLPGLLLTLVVLASREGLSSAEIGLLVALFGVSILLGSTLAGRVRRRFSARVIIRIEFWSSLTCVAFFVWPHAVVLALCLVPTGLAIPSTNSVVHAYSLALTPDRLRGRVESVRLTLSQLITPFGPLVAGVLLTSSTPRVTVLVFVACGVILAAGSTWLPSIRSAPEIEDLLGAAR